MFEFKTKNDVESLPPKLKKYFPIFLKKRISDICQLKEQLAKQDYSGLKLYCHKQGGIAASYHLFQLEELVLELYTAFSNDQYDKIEYLANEISNHLNSIEKSSSNWCE